MTGRRRITVVVVVVKVSVTPTTTRQIVIPVEVYPVVVVENLRAGPNRPRVVKQGLHMGGIVIEGILTR